MADIEANVENGTYHWGSVKDMTEPLISSPSMFGREILPRLEAHQVTRVPQAAGRH